MSPIGSKRMVIVISIIIVTVIIVSVVGYFLWNMFLSLFGTIEYGIEIYSDDDFLNYDFSGSGSIEDPYLIADYDFNGKYIGIIVQNVTKNFVISNCSISEFHIGIVLNDIRSDYAKIINNEITEGSWPEVGPYEGIKITDSQNILIKENVITSAGLDAILITSSENCTLIENNIQSFNTGIEVTHSSLITCIDSFISKTIFGIQFHEVSNYTISNNLIQLCDNDLINLDNTSYGYIFNNTLQNNAPLYEFEGRGFRLWDCLNLTICNNTIDHVHLGALVYHTSFSVFKFNLFQDCEEYGLLLPIECYLNVVYLNAFIDNYLGGISQAYDGWIENTNTWYDAVNLLGNFWSDYLGVGNYIIDGDAGSVDMYPLSSSPL